ncbi:MAG: caspase family protein [Nitrospira sp.]|nr:caspase family protein [Nitrospira sp.]
MLQIKRNSIVFLIGLSLLLSPNPARASEGQRDFSVTPKINMENVPITGNYWALIIGINQYQHVPHLETAVQDATAVRDVLIERYGFLHERVVELLDAQATRTEILNALYQLGRKAGSDDSVFIYFAGHGQYDDEGKLGWWVPV